MPVLVQISENPNCEALDAQVFQCQSAARVVTHLLTNHQGMTDWCPITGLDEDGVPCDATACLIEDSGEGACYLVVGGEWGLRAKPPESPDAWDVNNPSQWGIPFLVLGGGGEDLRFADATTSRHAS
jgi:hypothetical protein